MRYATVKGDTEVVARYLPSNYSVIATLEDGDVDTVLIGGEDSAGWGLDTYVLPRLASGLLFGKEVTPKA